MLRKFKFYSNLTRITGILYENQYTYFIISRSILLRICSALDKIVEKIQCFLVRASSYIPISRPTDETCNRFLFSIYTMCITLHVSSVKRSSSGVPHRTYILQFLCLCPSAALSCKKLQYTSYKTVPRTDTNTETGGSMYGEGLLMMSA
jgi:hypothetical protein